ncbi:MAG: hypothetical protein FWC11_00450 [Firmicutes bacterium]|nr:hypothetical protein [Bacillota bacterium]
MAIYKDLEDIEVERLCEINDIEALYEKGLREKKAGNFVEAKKFFTFSSQLGKYKSYAQLGSCFESEGDIKNAVKNYKLAFGYGVDAVAVHLATLILEKEKNLALYVLEQSALTGNKESREMLKRILA